MELMGIHWNHVWNIYNIFIFMITFVLIFVLLYNLVYMKLILKSCTATASFFSMLKVAWVFDIFPSFPKNWRSVFLLWWIALVSSKDFLKPSDFFGTYLHFHNILLVQSRNARYHSTFLYVLQFISLVFYIIHWKHISPV